MSGSEHDLRSAQAGKTAAAAHESTPMRDSLVYPCVDAGRTLTLGVRGLHAALAGLIAVLVHATLALVPRCWVGSASLRTTRSLEVGLGRPGTFVEAFVDARARRLCRRPFH